MITYKAGNIVIATIAFSGATGYKRRPAVVISADHFNQAGIKLISAAVTSNIAPPFRPGDTLLTDWKSAGLVKPSAVRGVLATIDTVDVVRTLGVMSEDDFKKVMQNLKSILKFDS
jgi:mRNA interferase MazF